MQLETTFAKHSAKLFNYAVALTRNRDQAAELVQETALRLFAARNLPKDEPALQAWMFTTLRRHWIDLLRQKTTRDGLVVCPFEAHNALPVDEALSVREAFQALSLSHREVLAAVDIAGFTYAQTAQMLDLPIGTIMSRVSRAREAMLRMLEPAALPELERRTAGE